MNTDGDEHDGNGVPTAMHGVSQATKKIEQDSAAGEFLRQGKVGKKSRNNETEKKEKSTEGAEPRKSGGEGAKVGSARSRSAAPGRKRRARPNSAATPKTRSRRMESVARAFWWGNQRRR